MIDHSTLKSLFSACKSEALFHRYITNNHIEPLLKNLSDAYQILVIGHSVNELPIYGIQLGNGKKRILMWSQMHGNESTTTKACFDLLNYFKKDDELLKNCSLYIIPILNPDGAKAYTRLNANDVDLNRDAQELTQPESRILKQVFKSFKPHFCFNLHGQRTIFSAGNTNNPATVSFLAPAQDKQCTVTPNRQVAMELIVSMNNMLQNVIPNCVGIYDDAFNINCVGDTFQSNNVPTVLFEAGHYNTDYNREEVRQFIFMSLLTALDTIDKNDSLGTNYQPYFDIPQNEKRFYDIIIRNARITNYSKDEVLDVAIQYEEVLRNEKVEFVPKIINFGNLSGFYAHNTINAKKQQVILGDHDKLVIENSIDFVTVDNELFSLKLSKIK